MMTLLPAVQNISIASSSLTILVYWFYAEYHILQGLSSDLYPELTRHIARGTPCMEVGWGKYGKEVVELCFSDIRDNSVTNPAPASVNTQGYI